MRIWNLRIDEPHKEIYQSLVDVNAAFWQFLYHPDGALAYAAVFGLWLVIPIGMIFGSRNLPPWWCLLGNFWAYLTSMFHDRGPLLDLTVGVKLLPEPQGADLTALVPAVADTEHQYVQEDHAG